MKNTDNKRFMQVLDSISDQILMHTPQQSLPAHMRHKSFNTQESTPVERISYLSSSYFGESPRPKIRE